MGLLDLLNGKQTYPAECIIKVGSGEEEITELYPLLTEVVVETSRANPAKTTMKFQTKRDEEGNYTVQDSGLLSPWEFFKIEAGFGEYSEEIMRGYIKEINSSYPGNAGEAMVTVICIDETLKMDRQQQDDDWGEDTATSDTEILSTIAGRQSLSVHADSGDGLSDLIIQQDKTDFQFLKERATANGYELIVREGEIYFGPLRVDIEAQETIMVYAGEDTHCYTFSVNDDGHKPDAISVSTASTDSSDEVANEVTSDLELMGPESADSSSSGLDDFTWRMTRSGTNEQESLAQAQRQANDNAMKVNADGEMDGSRYGHVLRVGEPVQVDGVGERYNGTYYVDTVTHKFDTDGYKQTFKLLRNAYGDDVESSDSAIAGLFSGSISISIG